MTPQLSKSKASKADAIIVAIGMELSNRSLNIWNAIEVAIESLDDSPENDFIEDCLIEARESIKYIARMVDAIAVYRKRQGIRPNRGDSQKMMLAIGENMELIDFNKAEDAGKGIEQDAVKNLVTQLLPAVQASTNEILATQRVALLQELGQWRDETLKQLNAMLTDQVTRLGSLKASIGLSVDGPESKA